MWCFRKKTRPHGINDAETWEEDQIANTLNLFEVSSARFTEIVTYTTASGKDIARCLEARAATKYYSGAQEAFTGNYNVLDPGCIIRRLTPTECARLQGFPDWWCDGLDTDEPTDDDIAFWENVFSVHSEVINGKPSTKTKNQVIKWLQHPHSDSAEYKMWGNGVALPCVDYVMAGIAYWSQQTIDEEPQTMHQITIEEWLNETD